jgi:3-hydroxyisobutyrate dehydrogenase-like beta-hydroxyacid dehydrogenase
MKIGFIGLGLMGGPMAANVLKAGHALKVYDLRKENAAALTASGATFADDAATDVDIVFTSLPGPPEVEAVSKTILGSAKPGTVWFDLSTNSVEMVRRIHARCAEKGIQMLDAPVSGGTSGAKSGRLALWVGGDEAAYQRCLPVIKAIADEPFYVGAIGAGTIAKLAHNVSTFTVHAALAEAFTMGVKAGVEPLALYRALRQGASGRARTFDRLAEKFLPGAYDPATFALKLAHKDVSLAVELGKSNGVPMHAAEHALAELTEGMRRGWGERDSRVFMTLQEERAGVSVRVPAEKLKEIR